MKTNKGFSLIEVLVTLVLTAVGVLGMFVLQSRSISYTQDTVQREQAITAVNDLVELMRVHRDDMYQNVPSVGGPSAQKTGTYGDYYKGLKSTTPVYSGNNLAFSKPTQCASSQKSLKDMAECWWFRNNLVLPEFKLEQLCPTQNGTSCAANYGGNNLLVEVTWAGRDDMCKEEVVQNGATVEVQTCRYSVRVEL